KCTWDRADMSNTWQEQVLYMDGDLTQVMLEDSHWDGVVCVESDLSGQDLRGQTLQRCQLTECKLEGCSCQNAMLEQSNFKGAFMRGAQLAHARASRAMFIHADLREACCQGGQYTQSLWADACLDQADFSGADLTQ